MSSLWFAAFTPRPRDANAFQSTHLLAPPKRLTSAWIHAERAVKTGEPLVSFSFNEYGVQRLTCRVARLEREGIEEEVEEDSVSASHAVRVHVSVCYRRSGAASVRRVGVCGVRETVCGDEASVHIVEDVRPDLTDVCQMLRQKGVLQHMANVHTVDLSEGLQARVPQRVGGAIPPDQYTSTER